MFTYLYYHEAMTNAINKAYDKQSKSRNGAYALVKVK